VVVQGFVHSWIFDRYDVVLNQESHNTK
jgi:hypothetical protein